MDQSRFTAGIVGPVALALSASLFFNPDLLVDMAASIVGDPALIMLSGALVMVAGLAIARSSPRLDAVAILGWLLIVGGVARVVFVRQIADLTGQVAATPNAQMIGAAVTGVIGLFFTYLGWIARPAASRPEA